MTEDYCVSGETVASWRNSPLVGNITLDASPVRVFTDTQLTSVVSTTVDGHTVIFTATSTGQLIKVHAPTMCNCRSHVTELVCVIVIHAVIAVRYLQLFA